MSEVRMVLRGESRTHRFLRARLTFLVAATLVVDAVATAAMYMLEHDDSRSGFDDIGGALVWVLAQLTTVSSQMPNPVTTPGRAIDIVLSIWAITVAARSRGPRLVGAIRLRRTSPRRRSDGVRADEPVPVGHERREAGLGLARARVCGGCAAPGRARRSRRAALPSPRRRPPAGP
jgi:hypothetical protein